jgi:hypothetical protein
MNIVNWIYFCSNRITNLKFNKKLAELFNILKTNPSMKKVE